MKRPYIEFTNADNVKYRIYFRKITKKDLKGARAKDAYGVTFSPDSKQPKIIIDPKIKDSKLLSVLIEEMTHSFFWDKKEKEVRLFARILSEIIYILGWEKTKEKKKCKE